MRQGTLARRYAKALYEIATETKAVDELLQSLRNVKEALGQSALLHKAFQNPLITPEEKEAVVKSITSNKLTLRLVRLLAEKKRLDILDLVCDQLQHLADLDGGITRIAVRTAFTLSEDQKRSIEKNLASSWGGRVVGSFAVAKELLGGIWMKVGDKVLDASLKGRIEDLRASFANSLN